MAGPYLKSGESIILTTDRVLIDDIEYDVILTSQRLALVDSDHTSDQPQVIPFATILSVKGGTTPAREPFITLTVIDPIGLEDQKTLDLIFSLQPSEDRTAECDLWVQKLIENIVSVRQEPAPTRKQQIPVKSQGIIPTVRRWVAPDMPEPHSQVTQESRRPSEELLSAMQKTSWETPDDTGKEPDDTRFLEQDVYPSQDDETGSQEPAPSSKEDIFATSTTPQEPPCQTNAESPGKDADISGSIMTVQDEDLVNTAKRPDQETIPPTLPDEQMQNEVEVKTQSPGLTHPNEDQADKETKGPGQAADIIESLKEGKTAVKIPPQMSLQPKNPPEPETPNILIREGSAGFPADEPLGQSADLETGKPYPAAETMAPIGTAPEQKEDHDLPAPEPRIKAGLPDTVVFPVISTVSPSDKTEGSEVKISPEVQATAHQTPAPHPGKIPGWLTVTIVLVFLIIIGGAAVILLHPAGNTDESNHPVITPAQTLPPNITTAPLMIPSEGVWVKVTYNGTFVGTYGNPGALKQVRGNGEQFYAIKNTNELVQASFTKQDDYGEVLTVEVYNNGKMVTQVSKSAPRGTISILVDPYTGKPPYIPVTTSSA